MTKGWIDKDCGACVGGRTSPYGDECDVCAGWGHYFVHLKSGRVAQYPGGPFLGRLTKEELKELRND